jgi:DHA1 family bicyclomycin/chloramphenicol resistance-like MFS transporter
MTLSPHLFIEGYSVRPTDFGWFYGTGSLAILIGSQVNRVMLRRFSSGDLLRWTTRFNLAACVLMAATVWRWPLLIPAFLGPLCLAFVMNGFSSPNAAAEAMAAAGWRAGAVSALMGFAQFGMGAVLTLLAVRLVEGSALDVALMLCATSVSAVLCLLFAPGPTRPRDAAGLADSQLRIQ